jgi:DNA polymerase III delta prime subunit
VANALLKTRAEPPADTMLFLTTYSKNFLLPTIISRCVLHHLPENFTAILPIEFAEWLEQVEIFLRKLLPNCSATNVLEIFSLLEMLSQNLEKFANDSDKIKNASIKDIQRVLLEAVTEKIWNIFHSQLLAHSIEQMMKIISKSSTILAVNGSFLHVMESIFLQIYQISGYGK